MSAIARPIRRNVHSRRGQAASRLAAAEQGSRPETPTSDSEVREWWLASPELAGKLR